MKESDVVELVALLRARYPRAKWHEDDRVTYRAWFDAMNDLPAPLVAQILPDMFKTSAFPPDPADIRSRLFSESGILPEPDEAWARAIDRIKGVSGADEVPYTINLVIKEVGGLFMLRSSERPEQDRERFIKAYTARRKKAMVDPQVIGMLDSLALTSGSGS